MLAWLALATVLAAPVATPATASAPKPVDLTASVAAAEATLTAAKLGPGTYDYDGAIARKSGLDPEGLAAQLDALTSVCTGTGTCQALLPHANLQDRLASALGWLGMTRHAGSLLRSQQRGSFAASQALDRLRTRLMIDALPQASCAPPTATELTRSAAELADFYVMRVRSGVLTPELLTNQERDDLAYFLASVAAAGHEIGAPSEATRSDPSDPARLAPPTSCAPSSSNSSRPPYAPATSLAAVATGKRYLATLGYPGKLDGAADAEHAWGGARHSFVMRDVAELAELTGDITLAYDLYRRADPGGGMCGTSYWSYWKTQVGGSIRSAERLGDCRPVIAERLLDIDSRGRQQRGPARPPGPRYRSPRRRRLRRPAAVSRRPADARARRRGRHASSLAAAPAAIKTAGLARLAKRGREDWGRRVYAIEGLAATGDRHTLTALLGLLGTLTPVDQARVVTTIGEAAQRPPHRPVRADPRRLRQRQQHLDPRGPDARTRLRHLADARAVRGARPRPAPARQPPRRPGRQRRDRGARQARGPGRPPHAAQAGADQALPPLRRRRHLRRAAPVHPRHRGHRRARRRPDRPRVAQVRRQARPLTYPAAELPVLHLTTEIHAPVARCFDLARSVDLHMHSTAATGETVVDGVRSGLMGPGDVVTWRARHFGVRQRLTSRITAFDRPHHFRDSMVRGAFARFNHDHRFHEVGGVTVMTDVFDFDSPLGPLGRIADALVLTAYLRRFLARRNDVLKTIAESDGWRALLRSSGHTPYHDEHADQRRRHARGSVPARARRREQRVAHARGRSAGRHRRARRADPPARATQPPRSPDLHWYHHTSDLELWVAGGRASGPPSTAA